MARFIPSVKKPCVVGAPYSPTREIDIDAARRTLTSRNVIPELRPQTTSFSPPNQTHFPTSPPFRASRQAAQAIARWQLDLLSWDRPSHHQSPAPSMRTAFVKWVTKEGALCGS